MAKNSKHIVLNQEQMDNEVNHSTSKMMNSAVLGKSSFLVVYLPIFTLQGIEGKCLNQWLKLFAFALLGALLCFCH